MVDDGEKRIAIKALELEVFFLQRGDIGVIAQFAIHMHLRLVIIAKPDAVELLFIDLTEEG